MDYTATYGPFVAMEHALGTQLSWHSGEWGSCSMQRSGTLVWTYVNIKGQHIYVIDTGWVFPVEIYKHVFVPIPLPVLTGPLPSTILVLPIASI